MTSFGRDASGFTDARRRYSMEENLFDFFDAPSGFSTRDVPVGGRSIREESFVDREPLTIAAEGIIISLFRRSRVYSREESRGERAETKRVTDDVCIFTRSRFFLARRQTRG